MKTKHLLLFTITSVFICACSAQTKISQSIELPKEWKFHKGDNPQFSQPNFDDTKWEKLSVNGFWEPQGLTNYDGFGWYRTKVVIPSYLKSNTEIIKAVRITLGKVDDTDDSYFNGQKIGSMVGWDFERSYLLPYNLVNWDKENSIAVRVTDFGGGGGMHSGPHTVTRIKLSDLVSIQTNSKPLEFALPLADISNALFFHFKTSVKKIEGKVYVKVYNHLTKKIVFTKQEPLIIGSELDTVYNININAKEFIPATYKIDYSFVANELPDTLHHTTLLTYSALPHVEEHREYPIINLTIADKSTPFDLENMTYEGYLNDRMNANLTQRLLNVDEIGILEGYYNRPGKQTWVGEYPGKYLHAAVRVWQSTKNVELKKQMDRIVDILIASQNEDGYLGTYMPADYWKDWDVWAHKYNILGLLSYYSITGHKPALESCIKMGDLLCKTFGENRNQLNIINSSGHVGMPSTSVLEPMTYLYRYTGDKKYLDFCNYIIKAYEFDNGPKIISSLTSLGKVDKTANAKAYEMMSNLTGIVKLYQLTGNQKLLKTANAAWEDIAKYKLYITGTASEREYFQEDFVLPANNDVHMGEGCVTTTWLQFSQALYYLTGEPKYITEIEKTIYNHLFAAENPITGCVSYYTALQGVKPYRCTIDAHCCLASIPRGIAAIPELANAKNAANGFNINLYSSETLKSDIYTANGTKLGIECKVVSNFPEKGSAIINLKPDTKSEFLVSLYVPEWCTNYFAVINGEKIKGIPGRYLDIQQIWDFNTVISVSFDMPTQLLDGGKSYPGFAALKYGTQILGVDQSLNPDVKDLDKLTLDEPKLSSLSKSNLPKGWVGSQIFKVNAQYYGKPLDIFLVPFADAGQKEGDVRVWIKRKNKL